MKRWLVILLLLFSFGHQSPAQVLTTEGNDFWIAFVPNHHRIGDLTLSISSDVPTTGVAASSDSTWSESFSVIPGVVTVVAVPSRFQLDTIDCQKKYRAIHVTTNDDISLYASNYLSASYDNTNVLPTNTLRNYYVIQTSDSTVFENTLGIIAIEDSTMVYINLTAYNKDSTMTPGVTDSVMLHSGQTYVVMSYDDISGSTVRAGGCKNIAVFTGNRCAQVPSTCAACDYLVEQSIPVEYWGRKFGVTISKLRLSDMLKVTALLDSTLVTYDDRTFMLNARESRTLNIIRPLSDAGFYLEGTKPLSVFLYLKGSQCAGLQGDPSCTAIHPIEQQISSVTFSTFNTSRVEAHYVNIVTRKIYAGNIFLDNNRIDTTAFQVLAGNPDYRYARIQVSHGSHNLYASEGGFVAHVYGLGEVESYSYAVGTTLDPINPQSFLNDFSFDMYDSTNNIFCLNEELEFRSEVVDIDNTIIRWDFGDGDTAVGSSFVHYYSQPGDYTVTVHYTHFSSCYGPTYYTQTLLIRVLAQPISVTDTIVCDTACLWNDQYYFSPGIYSVTFPTGDICDSIARLNLLELHLPPHLSASYSYDCEEHKCVIHAAGTGDYLRWHSNPFNPELNGHESDTMFSVTPSSTREYTLFMAYSYDSLCSADTSFIIPQISQFKALISADPPMANLDNTTITLTDISQNTNDRIWYVDGRIIGTTSKIEYNYPISKDSVTVTLIATSIYGCRDTAQMVIHLFLDGIYAPNVITPSRRDNNFFQVVGSSLMDGEIWIFDRRGAQVWYSNDIHARWDATYGGTPLPQGTYVYTLRYRQTSDPEVWLRKTGSVTVLR